MIVINCTRQDLILHTVEKTVLEVATAWGVQGLWWGLGISKLLASLAMLWRFAQKSRRFILSRGQQ